MIEMTGVAESDIAGTEAYSEKEYCVAELV